LSGLLPDAPSLSGRIVHLRGVLAVRPYADYSVGCDPGGCCNPRSGSVVLADGVDMIGLQGLSCGGDDSAICCDAPAEGQGVIVTGRLAPAGGRLAAIGWMLEAPVICASGNGR
jgi:hypothetical protein